MGIINVKDVVGIRLAEDKVVCRGCVEDYEWQREDGYEAILKSDVAKGESIFFCDRCKRKL